MLCVNKKYEGEGGTQLEHVPLVDVNEMNFDPNDDFIHRGAKDVEGDSAKSVTSIFSSALLHKLKQIS